jgi:C4-dicarboxylate transporter/malic acid transport protein
MTSTTLRHLPAAADPKPRLRPAHRLSRWGLLRELDRPGQMLKTITPNWYASIMGTGIVAVAAATLPMQFTGLRTAATVVWALAAFLLVALTVATALHWKRYAGIARGHARDAVMAQFYGAPPMAVLAVGAGTLLLGRDWIGLRAAIDVDWTLWLVGTVGGLVSAMVIPYLTFTTHEVRQDSAFGGWLMPIVPPMVSASTGALLLPYTAPGQLRLALLLCCYAMFGLSLLASVIVITLIWQRLAVYKAPPARMVPTLWIVLGPLGQSITAANLLSGDAGLSLHPPYSGAMESVGLLYGVPVWGFTLLWAGLAAAITVRTVRAGLPFSLTWWSFIFPVGTVVTGTSGLALHTGADLFRYAAVAFYVCLVLAWAVVAARTVRGSVRGSLFLTPKPAGV